MSVLNPFVEAVNGVEGPRNAECDPRLGTCEPHRGAKTCHAEGQKFARITLQAFRDLAKHSRTGRHRLQGGPIQAARDTSAITLRALQTSSI